MGQFFLGVIEGFYGRQWPWQARQDYAEFLAAHGFDCYIYAPKGDAYLRSRWRESHPPAMRRQLIELGDCYHRQGLRWGLGISPLGLSEDYSRRDKRILNEKIDQINDYNADILCILFDDSRGDIDGLADRQLAISADIMAATTAQSVMVCPTYYSFDPVLEQVFGTMPANYWQTLGAGLAEGVDILWTGNQVISSAYTEQDLRAISTLLGRAPLLWDNYPVNDGRKTSKYLHLNAYTGRPGQLRQWAAGHLVNPMNQPLLSQLPLQTLQRVYQQGDSYSASATLQSALEQLQPVELGECLRGDIELFQQRGLGQISEQLRQTKLEHYQRFDHPLASEVCEWLQGQYQFDPDCLTD